MRKLTCCTLRGSEKEDKAGLIGVSFALNSLSHMHFDDMAVYLRRERRNKFQLSEDDSNSLWVMELNTYETLEWNFVLREGVSSKFLFILYDMVVLETTLWNNPLILAL